MKSWQRCDAFNALDHSSRKLLTKDHQEETVVKILKFIEDYELADIVPLMSENLQAPMLISLEDSKRLKVLGLLEPGDKDRAISNITNYQEYVKWDWDLGGMCPLWVVTEEFPRITHSQWESTLSAKKVMIS